MDSIILIKAIDYIKENLEEDLTVEKIANHCNYSKFYFNRMFKSITGESVYAFIKRLKIEKSAGRMLLDKGNSITEISSDYGYTSSNYSTAFKKHFGKSPMGMKKERQGKMILENQAGFYADLSNRDFEYYNSRVHIVQVEDVEVIFKRHIVNYKELKRLWGEFLKEYGEYRMDSSKMIEVSYDDPMLTDPDRCITDICMSVEGEIPKGASTMILKGGKFASYKFIGENKEIFKEFQGFFGLWLTKAPYLIDCKERKIQARYNDDSCENNLLSVEILVPIKDYK